MRLPQDRILHIGTEIKDGKVNVVAEWQGDFVRCKDCRYRNGKVNSKGFEVCDATGMDITDEDFCSWGERREP